jgi:hypothetical protein
MRVGQKGAVVLAGGELSAHLGGVGGHHGVRAGAGVQGSGDVPGAAVRGGLDPDEVVRELGGQL